MRILGALVVLSVGAHAAHAGEGERALSVGLGLATYATPDAEMKETLTPTGGATAGVTFERALGDEVSVRADLGLAAYVGGGTVGVGLATVGLVYRIDILKYVPYVEVGVGALGRTGGPFATGVEPALRIGGGVDILRGRARSVGVTAAMTGYATSTTTFQVGLRSTWRWGYF
ncbi:MAG: hypothetical protein R3B06_18730 [Kofleriaceae bacterium]